jgi:uncharacterized protein
MTDRLSLACTAFRGPHTLVAGPLGTVALAVRRAQDAGAAEAILVFDDASGRVIDLDLSGDDDAILERLTQPPPACQGRYRPDPEARGRGRPKLGVVAREVTLLPRQWEWLAGRPGGASATLRRLVDAARRQDDPRRAQDAAYHFMLAMAGDRAGYEEATRALFAGDLAGLEQRIADWPGDIRAHVLRLVAG